VQTDDSVVELPSINIGRSVIDGDRFRLSWQLGVANIGDPRDGRRSILVDGDPRSDYRWDEPSIEIGSLSINLFIGSDQLDGPAVRAVG